MVLVFRLGFAVAAVGPATSCYSCIARMLDLCNSGMLPSGDRASNCCVGASSKRLGNVNTLQRSSFHSPLRYPPQRSCPRAEPHAARHTRIKRRTRASARHMRPCTPRRCTQSSTPNAMSFSRTMALKRARASAVARRAPTRLPSASSAPSATRKSMSATVR